MKRILFKAVLCGLKLYSVSGYEKSCQYGIFTEIHMAIRNKSIFIYNKKEIETFNKDSKIITIEWLHMQERS